MITYKPEYLTKAKYEAYKRQLEYMKREGSDKLAKLLSSSPGSGMGRPLDLPIHDMAREFRAQMREIDGKLHNAIIIEEYVKEKEDKTCIDLGATVSIRDEEFGDTSTYTIVGSDETSPAEGRISYLSPLGAALMGKKEGDMVTVTTNQTSFKVIRVEYMELDYEFDLRDWDSILNNLASH